MKIALLGSAASSLHLAPFHNEEYKIWGCSPGVALSIHPESGEFKLRVDSFFELHLYEPHQPWFSKGYKKFLADLECPLYMIEKVDEFPNSRPYPYEQIKGSNHRLSPYTSTVAWMLALAIQQEGIEEIGFWGIDMSANEEYASQLAGCHHWIIKGEEKGIKFVSPPESDLFNPYPEYGFQEATPRYIKFQARAAEIASRLRECEGLTDNHKADVMAARGALREREFLRSQGIQLDDKRDAEIKKMENASQLEWEKALRTSDFLKGGINNLQYIRDRWSK